MPKHKYSKPRTHEQTPETEPPIPSTDDNWMAVAEEKIRGIQNGTLQIIVHDSRVVQIEWNDRVRFNPPYNP